jgi:threonine/homoserine/homoserine lactone efflux protein
MIRRSLELYEADRHPKAQRRKTGPNRGLYYLLSLLYPSEYWACFGLHNQRLIMAINLIAGILTAFVVSMPPLGPTAFAIISKGFKNEIKEGRAIAFGAAFMDSVYCLIAFGGITLIISFFPSGAAAFYAENSQLIEIALTFAGCAFVIISSLKILKKRSRTTSWKRKSPPRSVRLLPRQTS